MQTHPFHNRFFLFILQLQQKPIHFSIFNCRFIHVPRIGFVEWTKILNELSTVRVRDGFVMKEEV